MKADDNNTCKSPHKLILLLTQVSILLLTLTSIILPDWVQGETWSGSLFSCTSGEYKGRQYFSIHCPPEGCIFHQLGKAGIVYVIFSTLSSILLITWIGVTIYQIRTEDKPEPCIKFFLSLGSCGCFYLGVVSWSLIAGFFNFGDQEQKCSTGVIIALFSCLLYSLAVILYYWVFRESGGLLITQAEENNKEVGDIPNMKSVRIEARFEYPISLEYENEGEIEL